MSSTIWKQNAKKAHQNPATVSRRQSLTQNTMRQFVECVNYFASNIISECKIFFEMIREKGVDLDTTSDINFQDKLHALETSLTGLETPLQQEAYFREVFNCVVNIISKFFLIKLKS